MKQEIQRIFVAMTIPLFILFIMYALKILEVGLDWDFTRLGVYPLHKKGVFGIFAHPFVHSGFRHLVANSLPFFFLSWCLFYFYREISPYIFFLIWICCGIMTFLIGKPGWHVGASGIIYGLAFFLFFSGLIRKHVPLIAISLLVTFLYGGLIWNMFPFFAKATTSWEGHLSGAVSGTVLAWLFRNYGPQKPVYFTDEDEDEDEEDEDDEGEESEEGDNNEKEKKGPETICPQEEESETSTSRI